MPERDWLELKKVKRDWLEVKPAESTPKMPAVQYKDEFKSRREKHRAELKAKSQKVFPGTDSDYTPVNFFREVWGEIVRERPITSKYLETVDKPLYFALLNYVKGAQAGKPGRATITFADLGITTERAVVKKMMYGGEKKQVLFPAEVSDNGLEDDPFFEAAGVRPRPLVAELQRYLPQPEGSHDESDFSTLLASERVAKVLKTEGMRKAFKEMVANTMSANPNDEKRVTVVEFLEAGMVDKEILQKYPTVYIGSGYDFQYPLLLGARKIHMVDPGLDSNDALQRLESDIGDVVGKDILKKQDNRFIFPFDFGEGEETVEIEVDGGAYGIRSENERQAKIPGQVGMAIGYASGRIFKDLSILNNVVPGGYVFGGTSTEDLMESLSDEKLTRYLDEIRKGEIISSLDLVRKVWADNGYEFLPDPGLVRKR